MTVVLPSVGERFEERYVLESVLGDGGFASVFEATDTATGRKVALKILRPQDGAYPSEVVSRFAREVRVVASLRDPHTVTLYDFGTSTAGLLFLVFEYVPGTDLSEFIDQHGAFSDHDAAYVLAQILRSLREAHAAGLLHRDIKPQNIRIYRYAGDNLRTKLLDFGIARPSHADEAQITRPGELVGTPHYMSPEQLLDQELTPASDLYSLGIVLLEMLSGRLDAHGGGWSDQLARLQDDHVFHLPDSARIGAQMRRIVSKMCKRRPAERFQSAGEVLRELDEPLSVDGSESGFRPLVRPEEIETDRVMRRAPPTTQAPQAPAPKARAEDQPDNQLPRWFVPLAGVLVLALGVSLGVVAHLATRPPESAVVATKRRELPPFLKTPVTKTPAMAAAPVPIADLGQDARGSIGKSVRGCSQREVHDGGITHLRTDSFGEPFMTYIPAGYDGHTPLPVVFLFHDAGQSPELIINRGRFGRTADEHSVILVAPEDDLVFDGTGFFARVWENEASWTRVEEIWASVQEQLCVDPERVFTVGQAAGGYAAEGLACRIPLAGIATNAHVKVVGDPTCDPVKPTPYIFLAGKDDQLAPEHGGVNCLEVSKLAWSEKVARWKKLNGLTGSPELYLDVAGGRCERWSGDAPFVQCALNGGREWPGAPRRIWDMVAQCAGTPARFPAAETIWRFFDESSAAPSASAREEMGR